jgi:hypothetical protein
MPHYYLRIEAVNLDYSVYDTYDISTIRGGSFLLLTAFDEIKRKAESKELELISSAASEALIKFEAENEKHAGELAEKYLATIPLPTRAVATFVSALIPIPENPQEAQKTFVAGLEKLKAACRWQQYQQWSFCLPDVDKTAQQPCSFDGVKPGIYPGPKPQQMLSIAVIIRREHGISLRQRVYREILADEAFVKQLTFPDDLEELTTDRARGNLSGKMAFIHLDGNRFGQIRDKICTDENALQKFQCHIQQTMRPVALRAILETLKHKETEVRFKLSQQSLINLREENIPDNTLQRLKQLKDKVFTNEKDFLTAVEKQIGDEQTGRYKKLILKHAETEFVRLETLLWGGDEIDWVVPAWQAWNVLKTFFTAAKQHQQYPSNLESALHLTHAVGVVFCHCKLPILQVREYARQLCDLAKPSRDLFPQAEQLNGAANRIAFLNMTAFDLIKGNVSEFLSDYHAPASVTEFILQADQLKEFEKHILTLKQNFPRNKLFDIVDALKNKQYDRIDAIRKRVCTVFPDRQEKLDCAIKAIVGDNLHRWFMIADLINYIGEDT